MNEQPKKSPQPSRPTGAKPRTNNKPKSGEGQQLAGRSVSRGAAIRAQKRNSEMANKLANEYLDA